MRCICDRMAIELLLSSVKVTTLIMFSLMLGTCAPLYKTLFTDEKEVIVSFVYPFIDPGSIVTLFINLVCQSIEASSAFIIVPVSELITCVLNNNITTTAAVVEIELIELKNKLELENKYSNEHALHYRDMIVKILDFNRFMSLIHMN